jgi:hypothetical protein
MLRHDRTCVHDATLNVQKIEPQQNLSDDVLDDRDGYLGIGLRFSEEVEVKAEDFGD